MKQRYAEGITNDDYSDIIHMPRPISTKHPPMPMMKRAAQFSAFAPLEGMNDDVTE